MRSADSLEALTSGGHLYALSTIPTAGSPMASTHTRVRQREVTPNRRSKSWLPRSGRDGQTTEEVQTEV